MGLEVRVEGFSHKLHLLAHKVYDCLGRFKVGGTWA
jgi:hypothetical protein